MHFRFSGHESFPLRYTWLPKAYRALAENPNLFKDDTNAMVRLGVGKNMVKSIRFWVQVFGVAEASGPGNVLVPTEFGHKLLSRNGFDPYLEDARTLWLLHWKVSSVQKDPLFAWYFMLNQWSEPTFSKSQVIEAFGIEAEKMDRKLADFTKEQHFDIFLDSYCANKGRRRDEVLEDRLDCPLSELELITLAGERSTSKNSRELIFAFNQNSKPEITGSLFSYCVFDYWQKNRTEERTLSFRDIAILPGSIGQVFKLSETDIRLRLESINIDSGGVFEYQASATVPRVVKHFHLNNATSDALLRRVYNSASVFTQTNLETAYAN